VTFATTLSRFAAEVDKMGHLASGKIA
jgi:hypothetical protein